MKEATGELNTTLIVVMIVGAVLAFFTLVIWPMLKNDMGNNSDCSKAVCGNNVENGRVECKVPGSTNTIWCPYKG